MAHVARAFLLTSPPGSFVRVVEAEPPFHSTSLEVFVPLRLEAAPDGSFDVHQTVKPKASPKAPETQGVRTRRNSGNQAVREAVPEEPALAESKERGSRRVEGRGASTTYPTRHPGTRFPARCVSPSTPSCRSPSATPRRLRLVLNLSNPREVTPSWCHAHGTTRSRYGLVGPGRKKNYTPSSWRQAQPQSSSSPALLNFFPFG